MTLFAQFIGHDSDLGFLLNKLFSELIEPGDESL